MYRKHSRFLFLTQRNHHQKLSLQVYKEYFPIVFNIHAEFHMIQNGIPYRTMWDFIHLKQFKDLDKELLQFCDSWLGHIREHLTYDRIDFFQAARFYPLFFAEHYLMARQFIQRFCDAVPAAEEVMIDTSLNKPSVTYNAHDVWEGTLIDTLVQKGININPIPTSPPAPASPSQSLKHQPAPQVNEQNEQDKWERPPFLSNKLNILFHGGTTDVNNSIGFLKGLKEKIPQSQTFLLSPDAPPTDANCQSPLPIIPLAHLPVNKDDLAKARTYFNQLLHHFHQTPTGNLSGDLSPHTREIRQNPFLTFQVNHLFLNVFEEIFLLSRKMRDLLSSDASFFLISGLNFSYTTRSIVLSCRAKSIPTLQLCHGAAVNPLQFSSASHFLEVWGKGMSQQLKKHCNASHHLITGSRNHDSYRHSENTKNSNKNSRDVKNNTTKSSRLKIKNILLLDSENPDKEMLHKVNFHHHLTLLLQLLKTLTSPEYRQYKVTVRSHPRFNNLQIIKAATAGSENIHYCAPQLTNREVLKNTDLVIAVNVPTTFLIDAMILQKPIIYLKNKALDYGPFERTKGILKVRTIMQMEQAIHQLQSYTGSLPGLLQAQRKFLKDYIIFDGKSEERLINHLITHLPTLSPYAVNKKKTK